MLGRALATASLAAGSLAGPLLSRQLPGALAQLGDCPGYTASNIQNEGSRLSAELTLAGDACNAYGSDIENLILTVEYQTSRRLHVSIVDAANEAYQVPESVFPRSQGLGVSPEESEVNFELEESPFSFKVVRKHSGDILFDTSAAPMVFEDQYLRLRTALPENPNLYGLGEHSDNLRLNTTNYTRTLWSRDSYGIPSGTNLYGNHPIYFDHRGKKGTHGVFVLSSSGMDIKVNRTAEAGQYLEYNVLGGIIDLYFLIGDSPAEVSREYAQVAGLPTMQPYWSLGFHNCRYGYRDFYAVAETIYNYSAAGIPLETMWTDIDYMYERWVFTTDPDRFPVSRMRDIVDYLHNHHQQYIVMVDPAVAYQNYTTFNRGVQDDIFMKFDNGTIFKGVVWPGPTAFPDWFHPNVQGFWNTEFLNFFSAQDGIDIDGLWIDMNEAANFCPFPCPNPEVYAEENSFPPERPFVRSQPRPIPGFPPEFQPGASDAPPDSTPYNDPSLAPASSASQPPSRFRKRQSQGSFSSELTTPIGIKGRDLLAPPYRINNAATGEKYGGLSNKTIRTDLHHANGLAELDVHNLYGTMMSETSRNAMISRRPGLRPLVITRSTFAGAGRKVGKWLGDNLSTWDMYRQSIQGMLDFSALYQLPMVGSDVCGFGGNTTEKLCARWAMLGAFNPFYRNHNQDSSLPQEFYIWPSVTQAAKKAIDIRYKLLDYFYTAMYQQSKDGTPSLQPLFFKYPTDSKTFAIEHQFFFGHDLLVSPVTEENGTSVEFYLPKDRFYDFFTYEAIQGRGAYVTRSNVDFDQIPLHISGGAILPMRVESANTTTELRTKPFEIVVALAEDGTAEGSLYVDDGVSIEQQGITYLRMKAGKGELKVEGEFGYKGEDLKVNKLTVLGAKSKPSYAKCKGRDVKVQEGKGGALVMEVDVPLTEGFQVKW